VGEDGTWKRIWRGLLTMRDEKGWLEWAKASLGGSFVPAKKVVEVGKTKRGKGTKVMLVADGNAPKSWSPTKPTTT
jgi:hypothetical protein